MEIIINNYRQKYPQNIQYTIRRMENNAKSTILSTESNRDKNKKKTSRKWQTKR